MGATKRAAEIAVQQAIARGVRVSCVRFGNVLDSRGSVVPIFRRQIAHGGPVTVTHPEATRYFMLIEEAARLVLQAGSLGRAGEIFVLDMGDPVRIIDLARDLIHLAGLKEPDDIEIHFTGLRPGERLHEHLEAAEGELRPTPFAGILVAPLAYAPAGTARQMLRTLADAVARHDDDAVVRILADEPVRLLHAASVGAAVMSEA
jgi:FlaA1/EpsC-like NDP-sugar epimerase